MPISILQKFCRQRLAMVLLVAIASLITGTSSVQAETRDVQIRQNGLTLNGRLNSGQSLKGSRLVLMLHGTLAHHGMEIIKGLQNALNERDIGTLAISLSLGQDNRRGMYNCQSPHRHHHEDALVELKAWIRWLEDAGVKEIVLLGHSRGGNQIAWYAAEHMQNSIIKIVLMAPQTAESDGPAAYEKNYGVPLRTILTRASKAGRGFLEQVDFIYCPKTKVRGDSFLSYYRPEPRRDTPGLLKQIQRPILLLIAQNDTVVTNLPERMKKLGPVDNVKTVVISEAGHMFLDFALEDAADAIAEFLE